MVCVDMASLFGVPRSLMIDIRYTTVSIDIDKSNLHNLHISLDFSEWIDNLSKRQCLFLVTYTAKYTNGASIGMILFSIFVDVEFDEKCQNLGH